MRLGALDLDDSRVFAVLWENAQVGLAIVGEDGHWLACNRVLCAFLEYSEAELRKLTWQEITHPGDLNADVEMAEGLARHPIGGYDMHKRYLCKSGRVVWAGLRVVPLVDEHGRFLAYLSQISPVVPIATAVEQPAKRRDYRWIKEYWPQLTAISTALAFVAAKVIEILTGTRHE